MQTTSSISLRYIRLINYSGYDLAARINLAQPHCNSSNSDRRVRHCMRMRTDNRIIARDTNYCAIALPVMVTRVCSAHTYTRCARLGSTYTQYSDLRSRSHLGTR